MKPSSQSKVATLNGVIRGGCPNERRTAAVWRARGPRVAFQLATVLVMMAGCSNDSNRLANGSTMKDVAQAVPTASPAPYPVQATLSENVVVPDVFAGIWDFNEGEAFHDAAAEGILLIEGPCVYIIHDHIIYDYPWIPPPSEDLPDPIRISWNCRGIRPATTQTPRRSGSTTMGPWPAATGS